MMHVPATVVKRLVRIAQAGYDRAQAELTSEQTGDDADPTAGEDENESTAGNREVASLPGGCFASDGGLRMNTPKGRHSTRSIDANTDYNCQNVESVNLKAHSPVGDRLRVSCCRLMLKRQWTGAPWTSPSRLRARCAGSTCGRFACV